MRPRDLIEFSREHYLKPSSIEGWSTDQLLDTGLSALEQDLLTKTGLSKGRLLLLGLGGGREAIPLAKMGFDVTGIDFVPQMIERAKENARDRGVEITGLMQEISCLELPNEAFDIAWLSAAMYSCVPTRKKRIAMLQRIGDALKPGACFVLGFFWDPGESGSTKSAFFRKTLAWLTLGNLQYEKGDNLRFGNEFIHAFTRVEDLRSEIEQGGFNLAEIQVGDAAQFAGAIAWKPLAREN